jgi:hypothetical protein
LIYSQLLSKLNFVPPYVEKFWGCQLSYPERIRIAMKNLLNSLQFFPGAGEILMQQGEL